MFKRQGIFKATAIMGVGRIFYQILAFAQFTYFLYAFGSTRITDTLIIAQTLPFLLSNFFRQGSAPAFITLFIDLRERKNKEEAWRFNSSLIILSLLTLCILMLVLFTLAPFFIGFLAPGFSPEDQKLGVSLLRCLSIFVILNGMSGIPQWLYFAYRSFTIPAITSLSLSISVIGAIFLFKDSMGIYAVVLGTIIGCFAQLVTLSLLLNKGERRLKFTLNFWHDEIRQFGILIGPRFISMVIARLNIIVDRWFASFLGPAYVSALSYGDRICTAPIEFTNLTFGVVIFPVLSEDATLGDMEKFKARICQYIRVVSFLIVPVAVLFLLVGEPLIQILFGRGALGRDGVPLISAALRFYSLGLLPIAVSTILRGSFFALKDTVTPLKIGILTFCLNITFDYILVRYFSIRGLALATSLVRWISAGLLFGLIQKKIGPVGFKEVQTAISKMALAGLTMGIVVWFFSSGSMLEALNSSLIARSLQLLIASILGGLTYFLICRSLRVSETGLLISQFRKMGFRPRDMDMADET